MTSSFIPGVSGVNEEACSITDYEGRFLVILFYHGDWEPECQQMIQSFSSIRDKFTDAGCALVACSSDGVKIHKNWIKSDR